MMKIAVLGDGVTATAVKRYLGNNNQYCLVELENADIIITSPGIPPHKFPDTTKEIISDIEFVYRILKKQKISPKIIGVTGTNGKSTVALGIAHVLNTTCFGNIGVPLIDYIDEIKSVDVIVLELSSYQLYSSPSLCCDIAIVLNISKDHLVWHGSFNAYVNSKLSVIKSCQQRVYLPKKYKQHINDEIITNNNIVFLETVSKLNMPQFIGDHNQKNAGIIYECARYCGLEHRYIIDRLNSFKLPKFRCEIIYSNNDLTIVNDSKATNFDATYVAAKCFKGETLLILSGISKEKFNDSWLKKVLKYCPYVYASGYLHNIKDQLSSFSKKNILFFPTLKEATKVAIKNHSKGVILFSPSGESFDEYKNYSHRGESFNQYVKEST